MMRQKPFLLHAKEDERVALLRKLAAAISARNKDPAKPDTERSDEVKPTAQE